MMNESEMNGGSSHSEEESLGDKIHVGSGSDSGKVISEDGLEVEVVNENVLENEVIIPEIGMKFDSVEEMFQCFKKYAKYKGFAARKRTSKKNEEGNLRSVTFACCRGGKTNCATGTALLPQPSNETGCNVKLTSSLGRDGKWRINKLILEHNHDLSPSKVWLFPCSREIDEHVKQQLEVDDIAGVGSKKRYNALVIEAAGHENLPFIEKDWLRSNGTTCRCQKSRCNSSVSKEHQIQSMVRNNKYIVTQKSKQDQFKRNMNDEKVQSETPITKTNKTSRDEGSDVGLEERKVKSRVSTSRVQLENDLEVYKTKCHELYMELEKKKMEFGDLESRKISVENELKEYKTMCAGLKEWITDLHEDQKVVCEREKRAQERITYLEEELKNMERVRFVQPKRDIKYLECIKRRAEDENEVWKKRFCELETRVLRMEAEKSNLRCMEPHASEKIGLEQGGLQNEVPHIVEGEKDINKTSKILGEISDGTNSSHVAHLQMK